MQNQSQNNKCQLINIIVVGSIATVAILYSVTLSVCSMFAISPSDALLAALKDTGLVALGALGTLLARTNSGEPPIGGLFDKQLLDATVQNTHSLNERIRQESSTKPVSVEVVNQPDNPVPVDPTPSTPTPSTPTPVL